MTLVRYLRSVPVFTVQGWIALLSIPLLLPVSLALESNQVGALLNASWLAWCMDTLDHYHRDFQEYGWSSHGEAGEPHLPLIAQLSEMLGFVMTAQFRPIVSRKLRLFLLYHLTKTLDATRPVIDNDGWEHTDMTDFILRHALDAARKVIEQAEHLTLSERDSLRVLDALENPPAPNAKLLAAARRLPKGA